MNTENQNTQSKPAIQALSDPAGSVGVWVIEPAYDSAYDSEVLRVSEDPDGRNAMERAQSILESKWDAFEPLEELNITVKIRRAFMHKSDLPDGI